MLGGGLGQGTRTDPKIGNYTKASVAFLVSFPSSLSSFTACWLEPIWTTLLDFSLGSRVPDLSSQPGSIDGWTSLVALSLTLVGPPNYSASYPSSSPLVPLPLPPLPVRFTGGWYAVKQPLWVSFSSSPILPFACQYSGGFVLCFCSYDLESDSVCERLNVIGTVRYVRVWAFFPYYIPSTENVRSNTHSFVIPSQTGPSTLENYNRLSRGRVDAEKSPFSPPRQHGHFSLTFKPYDDHFHTCHLESFF